MPENYTEQMFRIYDVIEGLGITRQVEGVEYIAYMLYRLHKDQGYTTVDKLYKTTADRFKRGLTAEKVKAEIMNVQKHVKHVMVDEGANGYKFNWAIEVAKKEYFDGNVDDILDTEKFIRCLLRVAFGE